MMATNGICYLCGREIGKGGIKSHILKSHIDNEGQQKCSLLKIEGYFKRDYWLYVDMSVDNTLESLDQFLRHIWLECCGHLSEFQNFGKKTKIGSFQVGDKILHEYDMGSTTETLITVMGTTWRKTQKEPVRLLARNVPPQFECGGCGAKAEFICPECVYDINSNPFFCAACAEEHEHNNILLPVTNSPRMGVCGYTGELDTFQYVQPKEQGKRIRQKPSN